MEEPILEELFIQTQRSLHHYRMVQHRKKQSVFDIRQGQGRILALLKKLDSITQKELSELLDIRQQSLGESLLKLEQNGFITRKQSKEDKRVMVVEITEKGKSFEFEKTDLNEIFDCLNRKEQQDLKYYLCRILERLEYVLQEEEQQEEQEEQEEQIEQETNLWNERRDFSRGREDFRERRRFRRRGDLPRDRRHFRKEYRYFEENSDF